MKIKTIIALILLGLLGIHGEDRLEEDFCSGDEYELDTNDDEDDQDRFCVGEDRVSLDDQENLCARLVGGPLTRSQTKDLVRRMYDLLVRPRNSRLPCRLAATQNLAAQRLIEFLMQEEFAFSDDDDQPPTPVKRQRIDADYCELYSIPNHRRDVSFRTMQNILQMVDQGKSEKTIKAKYKWFNRKFVANFRKCVASGGTSKAKMLSINDYVLDKVQDARNRRLPLHDRFLVEWGLEKSAQLNATSFFTASHTWVRNFKKKYGIVSRAITEYSSRTEQEQAEEIEANIRSFKANFARTEISYPRRLIWNVDQTGFAYELVDKRTLSWRGERDTIVNIDSKNRQSHSFTSQPVIARDGRIVGKLLLCMQEPKGEFGPIVGPKVRRLERILKNIRVFASSSGKMSSELMFNWIEDVLSPARNDELTPEDGRTEIYEYSNGTVGSILADDNAEEESPIPEPQRPVVLLLMDSWTGQTNHLVQDKLAEQLIETLIIPAHTTKYLQPLDKTFNRQYKKFVKNILQRALYEGKINKMTSREGVIMLHSRIWEQFSSVRYQDMLRYAWRGADEAFVNQELSTGPPPNMVFDIQFNFHHSRKCNWCENKAVIMCAHNDKAACLDHFMLGKCSLNPSNETYESDPILAQPYGEEVVTN